MTSSEPTSLSQKYHLSVDNLFKFVEGPLIHKLAMAAIKAAKGASSRNIDNALDTIDGSSSAKASRGGDEGANSDGESDGGQGGRESAEESESEKEDDDENGEDAGTLLSSAKHRHSEVRIYLGQTHLCSSYAI